MHTKDVSNKQCYFKLSPDFLDPQSSISFTHIKREIVLPVKTTNSSMILLLVILKHALSVRTLLLIIGASLSEPHTSVTAFAEVVCMFVPIYRKF